MVTLSVFVDAIVRHLQHVYVFCSAADALDGMLHKAWDAFRCWCSSTCEWLVGSALPPCGTEGDASADRLGGVNEFSCCTVVQIVPTDLHFVKARASASFAPLRAQVRINPFNARVAFAYIDP